MSSSGCLSEVGESNLHNMWSGRDKCALAVVSLLFRFAVSLHFRAKGKCCDDGSNSGQL